MSTDLTEFYKKEYETISVAHFKASERITSFFQYALALLSVPITIFGLLLKNTTPAPNTTQVPIDEATIGLICISISVVGFFITMYLGQIRTEVLMYARCINTIRNYFYNLEKDPVPPGAIPVLHEYEVLLNQKSKPKYWDGEQFVYIVLSLGIINSLYLWYAMHILVSNQVLGVFISVCYFFGHFAFYMVLTRTSESNCRYFKHIIGIDIDGVLNLHKEQFVNTYNRMVSDGTICAAKISESDITTIPIHDAGRIKELDERKVFQNSYYWDTMRPNINAARVLVETIKNKYGFRVHIFTSRDWKVIYECSGDYDIKKETVKWLERNAFKWDRIKFESGNYDHPIGVRTALYANRFYLSAKRKIEFFVEDEPLKAVKLSRSCRYVLLIDHPYNRNISLPYNVIRVKDWVEIESVIRKLI